MTRCGERSCRQQAHRIPPPPSNLRYGQPPILGDWIRTDPSYDEPGPIRRSDLSWQLVVEALVVFAAIVLFVVLASLVAVE